MKKFPVKTVCLCVNSWVGIGAGACHTYGQLKQNYGEYKDRKTIEVKQTLTRQSQCDCLLNKSVIDPPKYKIGDITGDFLSEKEVISAALKTWKKEFPDAEILVLGDSGRLEPQFVISGNSKLKRSINKLWHEFIKLGQWEIPENEKRCEEICKEWERLMRIS